MSNYPRVSEHPPIIIIPLFVWHEPGEMDQYHLVSADGFWSLREGTWRQQTPVKFILVDGASLWGKSLSQAQAVETARRFLLGAANLPSTSL